MSRHRRSSPLARVTEPLAFADDRVNSMTDWMTRRTPWAFWPAQPPNPRQPLGRDIHAAYLAQTVLLTAAVEGAAHRLGEQPNSRSLRRDRAIHLGATAGIWAITTGAWDRRAARRRLPWR